MGLANEEGLHGRWGHCWLKQLVLSPTVTIAILEVDKHPSLSRSWDQCTSTTSFYLCWLRLQAWRSMNTLDLRLIAVIGNPWIDVASQLVPPPTLYSMTSKAMKAYARIKLLHDDPVLKEKRRTNCGRQRNRNWEKGRWIRDFLEEKWKKWVRMK